ncbi:MAG: hypothetical protein ABFR62_06980 [Bacteroidota bacterium]
MRTKILKKLMLLALVSGLFIGCEKNDIVETSNSGQDLTLKKSATNDNGQGFIHGIKIKIDGYDYYFAGPKDGPNGESDVPGHYWRQAGPNKVNGKHYNSGPLGSEWKFWASEEELGEYLYTVKGIIDIWTPELAEEYAKKGFVHRHEFVPVMEGTPPTNKVIWLKHIAVKSFNFDGPNAPNSMHEHLVTPGVDWDFPNNYFMDPFAE